MKKRVGYVNFQIAGKIMTINFSILSIILLSLFFFPNYTFAQVQNSLLGQTPAAIAPGTPSGSYSLSNIESISLYGGRVNVTIPLLPIGGRGGAGFSLVASPEQSAWVTESGGPNGSGGYVTVYDTNHPELTPNHPVPWTKPAPLGAGFLSQRTICKLPYNPQNTDDPPTDWGLIAMAIVYSSPDGTEHYLIDEATGGSENPADSQRGKIFSAKDGSGLTFVSDAELGTYFCTISPSSIPSVETFPNGDLKAKDGTTTRFVNGYPLWSRDRNGNLITYTHTNGKLTGITDSINHVVQINGNQISFKGTNGVSRAVSVNYSSLSNNLRAGYVSGDLSTIFPRILTTSHYHNPNVLSTVTLPDGRYYRFYYNPYGELARMETPGGAAVEYDYGAGFTPDNNSYYDDGQVGQMAPYPFINPNIVVYRRLLERREYANGGTTPTLKTTYGRFEVNISTYQDGKTRTEQIDPNTSIVLSRQDHYFLGLPTSGLYGGGPFLSDDGTETKTESLEISGNTVLSKIESEWKWGCLGPRANCGTGSIPLPWGRLLEKTTSSIYDNSTSQYLVTKKEFGYDKYNNLTDTSEYDFTTNQTFSLLRHSHTDYVTDPNYTSETGPHLRQLPLQSWVAADSSGSNKSALAVFEYDNYTNDVHHAGLTDYADISGLCTYRTTQHICANSSGGSGPAGYLTRGNLTAQTSYLLNVSGGHAAPISSFSQYDVAGNAVKFIDAKDYAMTINYSDRFGIPDPEVMSNTSPAELANVSQQSYAFPTSITNPLNWTAFAQYDYYTGAAVNSQDINGIISKTVSNDFLDRPTQSVTAIDTDFERQSNIIYDDFNHRIEMKSDLFALNDNLSKSESLYDGLGRTIESRRYESGGGFIAVKSVPFVMVRDPETSVWRAGTQVSNPYRPGAGEQPVWTTSLSDDLGRAVKVITPDGAITKTVYNGNAVTITDQAGKQRRSVTNALGELTRMDEPTDAGLGSINTPNQPTIYSYDRLGNLTSVTQNGTGTGQCGAGNASCSQSRTFVYDSLSRLKSATNPEAGLINYVYDNNGNLTSKIDARNITTTYDYDALNRVTARNYNDGITPAVAYTYDNLPNAKGKLIKVESSVSKTEYQAFDILGRVTQSQQTTGGATYGAPMTYKYNLSGAVIEETYPSTRVVKNVLDNNGDLSIVQSKKNGNSGYFDYAKSFTYTAAGAVSSMQLGNGKWESTVFNSRLQPTQIALGTTNSGTDKLLLNFDYGGGGNNGNVQWQKITVPTTGSTPGFVATQNYTYDALNRLQSAEETIPGQTGWKQTFKYDRYGNRTFDETSVSGSYQTTTLSRNCPTSTYNPNGICDKKAANPTISPSDNRIIQDQDGDQVNDYLYDPAGNVAKDANGRTFTYDGENKQTEVKDAQNNSLGQYSYDGDGKRVKKYLLGSGETTIFVYDASGKMVAEYSTIVEQAVTAQVSYLTNDQLGSPRMTTDRDGKVFSRRDFMPFGEEIRMATTPQRSVNLNYGDDGLRQKFTSYERDKETDLDYAKARYYAKNLGRFMSPDPLFIDLRRLSDPQLINIYSYTRNNPVRYTDSTGLDITFKCEEQKNCDAARDDFNKRKGQQFQVKFGKDNKLEVVGKVDVSKLTKSEAELYKAIKNTTKHATLEVGQITEDGKSQSDFGVNVSKGVNKVDLENISKLDAKGNQGGLSSGDVIAHEALEAFYTLSMSLENSHSAVSALGFPGLFRPTHAELPRYKVNGEGYFSKYAIFSQGIDDGRGSMRIRITFNSPIPYESIAPDINSGEDIASEIRSTGARVTEVNYVPKKPNK